MLSGEPHALAALLSPPPWPGERTLVPMNRRLNGPKNWSGSFWRGVNVLPELRFKP